MSASKPGRQRSVLTEDGELQEAVNLEVSEQPGAQTAPIYCIHCGSANRAEGRFCRKCGQPLDDQAVDPAMVPDYIPSVGEKSKRLRKEHAEQPAPTPFAALMSPQMALVQVFTLIFVGVTVLFSLMAQAPFIAVVILLAWFLVEAAWSGALK